MHPTLTPIQAHAHARNIPAHIASTKEQARREEWSSVCRSSLHGCILENTHTCIHTGASTHLWMALTAGSLYGHAYSPNHTYAHTRIHIHTGEGTYIKIAALQKLFSVYAYSNTWRHISSTQTQVRMLEWLSCRSSLITHTRTHISWTQTQADKTEWPSCRSCWIRLWILESKQMQVRTLECPSCRSSLCSIVRAGIFWLTRSMNLRVLPPTPARIYHVCIHTHASFDTHA
jgi:hypothetical protein